MALIRTGGSGAALNAQTITNTATIQYNTATEIDLSSYDFTEVVGVVLTITPSGYTPSLSASFVNNGVLSEVKYMGSYDATLTRTVVIDNASKKVTLTIGLASAGSPTNTVEYAIEVV